MTFEVGGWRWAEPRGAATRSLLREQQTHGAHGQSTFRYRRWEGKGTETPWLIGSTDGHHNSNSDNDNNTLKEVFLLRRSSCKTKTS